MKEKLKQELIFIGSEEIIPHDSILSNVSGFPYIYDFLKEELLSNEELIQIFKGVVVAEKLLFGGGWGSITPAPHFYQEIKRRGLDRDYSLADWAFQYADNEYVPFGFIRHGERTAYEYLEWRDNYYRRVMQEQLDAKRRKEQKKERAKKIEKEKRLTDEINRKIREDIIKLTPAQQIKIISQDRVHNFLFYVPVIRHLLARQDVLRDDWENLLMIFSLQPETPFNRKLRKTIEIKLNEN